MITNPLWLFASDVVNSEKRSQLSFFCNVSIIFHNNHLAPLFRTLQLASFRRIGGVGVAPEPSRSRGPRAVVFALSQPLKVER
jgi:hypothetical protein